MPGVSEAIGAALMELKCPHCGSVIYSRRNVLCGRCGKELPKELLFSDVERTAVEQELEEARGQWLDR